MILDNDMPDGDNDIINDYNDNVIMIVMLIIMNNDDNN